MKKIEFLLLYANLPLEDRHDILELSRKKITWHDTYEEIKENTELGRIILKKLNKKKLK